MKKLFFLLLAASTYASCATTKNISETADILIEEPIQKTYAVGDTAHGGIVFLVNEDGTHGLVVALKDQFENSAYNECADMMNNPIYHDSLGAQYFDWRLPKVWEAYKMYMNLHLMNQGEFSNSGYWTSQGPTSFDKISLINFSNGLEFTSLKSDTYRARAVREF